MKTRIFTLVLSFLIFQSVMAQFPFDTCLIVHYPFNNNALDESGNDYHGTTHGASLCVDRFNNANSAYLFNGYSDYISLNNNDPIINSAPFTISIWANILGPGGGVHSGNTLFEQRDDDATPNTKSTIVLYADDLYGNTRFLLRTNESNNGEYVDITHPHPGYYLWHHYVGVIDSNNVMSLYIDGLNVAKTTFNQTGNFYTSINYTDIGQHKYEGTLWQSFNGLIDDIRIYNCGLNEEEILELYSITTNVQENSKLTNLTIYPNPANDKIFIRDDGNNYTKIEIFNTFGKLVKYENSKLKRPIDISTLPKGIYLVRATNDQNRAITQRIIKY